MLALPKLVSGYVACSIQCNQQLYTVLEFWVYIPHNYANLISFNFCMHIQQYCMVRRIKIAEENCDG